MTPDPAAHREGHPPSPERIEFIRRTFRDKHFLREHVADETVAELLAAVDARDAALAESEGLVRRLVEGLEIYSEYVPPKNAYQSEKVTIRLARVAAIYEEARAHLVPPPSREAEKKT